jgi:hypothetical protein
VNTQSPSVRIAARRRTGLKWLAAICGVFGATLACAELPAWAPAPKPRVVEDRFRVEVNVVWASSDTRLRVDPSATQQGTLLDTEDDLGLDENELLAQAELTLLPGERHLVRLSALSSRRSAQTVILRQIRFEDDVYNSGERVDSEMNLALFGLTYGYRFLVQDRAELTGTFGIQIASFDANAEVRSRVLREAENGVAPLPLLGLEGRYDFTDRWSAEARYQYLTANIDDVDGSIADGRLALTWRANPYLVLGLGYRRFSVNIDSENTGTPGVVDMQIAGPLLFMRASM